MRLRELSLNTLKDYRDAAVQWTVIVAFLLLATTIGVGSYIGLFQLP